MAAGDSDFNAMFCKKHVVMLLNKSKSERQLDISIKCTFLLFYKIKIKYIAALSWQRWNFSIYNHYVQI